MTQKKCLIRRYACFTKEQQEAYEKLNAMQRAYVDYRGQGNSKANSYRMAGYKSSNPSQAAYITERNNKVLGELSEIILANRKVKEMAKEDSDINRQIDALAMQESDNKVLETIENADGETARRIQFYRDVINGRIKTVKKITKKNAMGATVETRIEETSDVETKMKARKELDRILGLNEIPNLGSLQMGDITINIVDASKKEELEDSRNTILLDPEKVEEIDGEQVIVENDEVEKAAPKDEFYEKVEE